MQNKMAESRNTLGGGAIASRLNSPIMQKVGDKLFFTLQNSLITKTIKAFSIAEAMITLTIVSVIAASVAPMISKQVKINEMGDVQANILNQKIIDLSKTKWFHTPDKKSITRPDGNVGIGVSEGTNPEAKLEVKNDNSSLVGLKLSNSNQFNSNILDVNKGNKLVFDITGSGMTQARNGLEIFYPDQSEGIANYLTTWKDGYVTGTRPTTGWWRHILTNDGGIYTHAGGADAMVLKNDEDKNLLVSHSDGSFKVGYRKIGTEENHPRFYINHSGQVVIVAPTREERYPDDPDNAKRNDVRALSIRYPEDSSADLDCDEYDSVENCIIPRTDDGVTETAFFNSVGSLYINSLIKGFLNEAIAVRNGNIYRAWIRTDGQINIAVSDAAPGGIALVVREPMAKSLTPNAWIKRNGSAWFKGNVTVDGTIANVELDTKLASLNKDLSEAKELIAELRLQNEMLAEKVALLEMNISKPLIYETIKSAQEKNNKSNQILGFIRK